MWISLNTSYTQAATVAGCTFQAGNVDMETFTYHKITLMKKTRSRREQIPPLNVNLGDFHLTQSYTQLPRLQDQALDGTLWSWGVLNIKCFDLGYYTYHCLRHAEITLLKFKN